MAVDVILPKVDMDMDTGSISRWHVKDGDTVAKGQAIFEIETDKSAMEIESPADGVIKISQVTTGEPVAIGTVVALVFGKHEVPTDFAGATPAAPPVAAAPAAKVEATPAPPLGASPGQVRSTPLARRLARQQGVPLTAIKGSGPQGRIVAADVGQHRATAALPESPQQMIAVPQFCLTATCTVDRLLALCTRLNAAARDGAYTLSINDFTLKAYAIALQNVSGVEDDIAFHVAGAGVMPVMRGAGGKSLSAISRDVADLEKRAQSGSLQPHECQVSRAVLADMGMLGVEQFTASLNPRQAFVLAMGAAVERFVAVKGFPVLATQMTVTLTVDSRAMTADVAAGLLVAIKTLVEDPALMLV